jgi:hypothetical protein
MTLFFSQLRRIFSLLCDQNTATAIKSSDNISFGCLVPWLRAEGQKSFDSRQLGREQQDQDLAGARATHESKLWTQP